MSRPADASYRASAEANSHHDNDGVAQVVDFDSNENEDLPVDSTAYAPASKPPRDRDRDRDRESAADRHHRRHSTAGGGDAGGEEPPLPPMAPLPDFVGVIPSPLRTLFTFIFFGHIRAGDTFPAWLAKIFLGWCFIVGICLLALAIPNSIAAVSTGSVGVSVAAISPTAVCIGCIGSWTLVKLAPPRYMLAVDLMLMSAVFSELSASVSDMTYPLYVTAGQLSIFSIALGSTRAPLFCFCFFIEFWVSAYNTASFAPGDLLMPLASVPDPLVLDDFASRIYNFFVAFVTTVMTIVIVVAVQRESARRIAASAVSIDVASELAEALVRYDTKSAREILEAARDEGAADAALMDKFDAIVGNLDRYRPHLPNWMVRPPSSSDGYDDDEDGAASASQRSRSNSNASDTASVHSSHSRPSRRSQRLPSATHSEALTSVLADGVPRKLKVAIAELRFDIPRASDVAAARPGTSGMAARHAMAAAAHGFVDRVHRVAGATAGAVHGFVGDAVRVTWNAAAKAVQPEAKAARFMARLKADAGHALVTAWGAAAFGEARVQLAGTAGHQQALLVTPGFLPAWAAALRLADRHRAFIVDGRLLAGANHSVECRGAAFQPPEGRKRGLSLFEVLAEHAEAPDEWLFVVERPAAHPSSSINSILCEIAMSGAAGNVSKAQELAMTVSARHSPSPVIASLFQSVCDLDEIPGGASASGASGPAAGSGSTASCPALSFPPPLPPASPS